MTAALGVVLDISNNKQKIFGGHEISQQVVHKTRDRNKD